MARSLAPTETMSRQSLVRALRSELARRARGDMSICRLAATAGIFCKGFSRYTDEELKERYGWIARRHPDATRDDIEDIADRWQVARQEFEGVPTSCDVQQIEHDVCGGWDDFSNDDLSGFLHELTGRNVVVG